MEVPARTDQSRLTTPAHTGKGASLDHLFGDGIIVCPTCHGALKEKSSSGYACEVCLRTYLSADGIPILLHDDSAFTPEQVTASMTTYFSRKVKENRLRRKVRQSLPALANDYSQVRVDALVRDRLPAGPRPGRGFVCGAGEDPRKCAGRFPGVEWLTSDVDLSYRPDLIADTQALPISDASQDLVVAEMVLEHVMDITQASRELQRVCKVGGIILIKVPFCFPWHGVPYDFFRCTPSGMRALFRWMETVYIGECMGPWGALAYQLDSLFIRAAPTRILRWGAAFLSRFLFGWLKWFDLLAGSRGSRLVTTAGMTFIGQKRDTPYTSREIIAELQAQFGDGMNW